MEERAVRGRRFLMVLIIYRRTILRCPASATSINVRSFTPVGSNRARTRCGSGSDAGGASSLSPLVLHQSCWMASVEHRMPSTKPNAVRRMPSTTKTNADVANTDFQRSRKAKLSAEYHESHSPSRRSVPSQTQRLKSVSASSAHQDALADAHRPKAAPLPLHAMQATGPPRSHTAPYALFIFKPSANAHAPTLLTRCSSMACPDQIASRPRSTRPPAAAHPLQTRPGGAR